MPVPEEPPPGEPGPSRPAGSPTAQVASWADDLSDRVIEGVAWVKDRTTVRVVTVVRAVVYGSVVLAAVTAAAVLGVISVVRMWDAYLPLGPVGRRVWLGYVVVGGLLFISGALVLSRRRPARRS
jgi:hypothetical protein